MKKEDRDQQKAEIGKHSTFNTEHPTSNIEWGEGKFGLDGVSPHREGLKQRTSTFNAEQATGTPCEGTRPTAAFQGKQRTFNIQRPTPNILPGLRESMAAKTHKIRIKTGYSARAMGTEEFVLSAPSAPSAVKFFVRSPPLSAAFVKLMSKCFSALPICPF
jgi:hypothetical protein